MNPAKTIDRRESEPLKPSLEEIAAKSPLSLKQLKTIEDLIRSRGDFTARRIRTEIAWFCLELGIAEYYFKHTPLEEIARHIETLWANRIVLENSAGRAASIQLISEKGESGTYMVEDDFERIRILKGRIEKQYPAFRLQSYRCRGYPLRFYVVDRAHFAPDSPSDNPDFEEVASREFLENSPRKTISRYRSLWKRMKGCDVPRISFSEIPSQEETRIMVGMGRAAARGFFTNYTFLLKKHRAHINREYVEPFADGTVIFSFYLDRKKKDLELDRLFQDITMAAMLPAGKLSELFYSGDFSAEETMYAAAAAQFAHQFLTTYTEEYLQLSRALGDKPELLGLLSLFKTHLAKDTYHEDRIMNVLLDHREITRLLFRDFFHRYFPDDDNRVKENPHPARTRKKMTEEVTSDIARHIIEAILVFNHSIQKTNFFKREKVCCSFRLDPSFLNPVDYPEKPFGIFYLIGKGFRGFHIRFRDIARGGIRMVKSPTQADYDLNSDFIFDENYNLALTQQSKNKDIPEGGAKGTILPGRDFNDSGEIIFRHYINGLLDLLLLPSPDIVDNYGKEEILFLGPDEGTADLMDWAALRARRRGYRYWKAFTTGKAPELGGIPHDINGMTTQGVHQYVKEVLKVLGLKESEITKFQTGGPDGDLGSNEILISKDKTLAVIDGSGVLYDPAGLNRAELKKLARKRSPVSEYDKRKLSREGFFAGIGERDITLPDGTVIPNAQELRDRFHFYPGLSADLFVPCGGRPRAISINNWKDFLDVDGLPRARIVVEGANLFITQDARFRLEENGVILFKDASANKGGVTSSSLEVLASLAFNDSEFERMMTVSPGGKEPEFRRNYVKDIIKIIRKNAADEFAALWDENHSSGRPLSQLSDLLSDKINTLTDTVYRSDLYSDRELREKVIAGYCPQSLRDQLGLKTIMRRVPDKYLKAIFASALASRFVYEKGLATDELDFYSYLRT